MAFAVRSPWRTKRYAPRREFGVDEGEDEAVTAAAGRRRRRELEKCILREE